MEAYDQWRHKADPKVSEIFHQILVLFSNIKFRLTVTTAFTWQSPIGTKRFLKKWESYQEKKAKTMRKEKNRQ